MKRQAIFEPKITLQKFDQDLVLTIECALGVNRNPLFTMLRLPKDFQAITFDVRDPHGEDLERPAPDFMNVAADILVNNQIVETLPLRFYLQEPSSPKNEPSYDTDLYWGGLPRGVNLKAYVKGRMADALAHAFTQYAKNLQSPLSQQPCLPLSSATTDSAPPAKPSRGLGAFAAKTATIAAGVVLSLVTLAALSSAFSDKPPSSSHLASTVTPASPPEGLLPDDPYQGESSSRSGEVQPHAKAHGDQDPMAKTDAKVVDKVDEGLQYDPVKEHLALIQKAYNMKGIDVDAVRGDSGCVVPMQQ